MSKTYEELKARLDKLMAEHTDTVSAEAENEAKAKAYNDYWEYMQTGVAYNSLRGNSDGSGGYLVPDEYDNKLITALRETNILRQLGHVISAKHNFKIPVVNSHGTATWIDPLHPVFESPEEFGQVEITPHKLATMIRLSDELLEDSAIPLEEYIQKEYAAIIGDAEEEAFFSGDGNGKPLGLIYQAPVGGMTEQPSTITMDDVIDLTFSVKDCYRNKAVFVMTEKAYRELRKTKYHNGRYIWNSNYAKDGYDTLFGKRVYVTNRFEDSNRPVLYGDFSYFWIVQHGKRVIKRLVERYADYGQVAYIMSERVDAKLVLPEAVKCLEVRQ